MRAIAHLPTNVQRPEAFLAVTAVPGGDEVGRVIAVSPTARGALVLLDIDDAALIGPPREFSIGFERRREPPRPELEGEARRSPRCAAELGRHRCELRTGHGGAMHSAAGGAIRWIRHRAPVRAAAVWAQEGETA